MVVRTQGLPSPIPSVPDPAVQEVITLTVLPGRRYPELINDDETLQEIRSRSPTRRWPMCRRRCGRRLNRPTSRRGREGTGVGRVFRRRWRHQHDRDRRKPHRPGKSPALGLRACGLAPTLSRRLHPNRR
jgi:hypothetical protein